MKRAADDAGGGSKKSRHEDGTSLFVCRSVPGFVKSLYRFGSKNDILGSESFEPYARAHQLVFEDCLT